MMIRPLVIALLLAATLIGGLACSHVVVGADFVFGRGRQGNSQMLRDRLGAAGPGERADLEAELHLRSVPNARARCDATLRLHISRALLDRRPAGQANPSLVVGPAHLDPDFVTDLDQILDLLDAEVGQEEAVDHVLRNHRKSNVASHRDV